ncbi:hypothetical protein [Clostridium brassicae]|uniref:Uncharacterized protein n=1 Tax=Clostridium brassicae TaxID=2999072 RepID=A0ABT4DCA3_9CLOT|nr:hypothetical protein [Clostridium brassicae]MCY6959917.1 hypothetical protein [Clostridium brassicae]
MVKIQSDKIFHKQIVNNLKNNHDYTKKKKIFDVKRSSSNNPKVRTYKYFLEGGVIKLYIVENGIKKDCIKTIPLKDASPAILAQVENLTPLDMLMITEMQQNENKSKEDSIYATKSYLRKLK